jgi:hypothetical protein
MEDDKRMRMSFDITREQLSIITTEEPTSVSIKDRIWEEDEDWGKLRRRITFIFRIEFELYGGTLFCFYVRKN